MSIFRGMHASWLDDAQYSKPAKVGIAIITLAILALGIVFGVIIYWKINPAVGVTYSSNHLTVEPTEVKPGDVLVMTSQGTYCNNGYDVTVERRISSRLGYLSLPTIGFVAPEAPVCFDNFPSVITIPDEVPPGEWQIVTITSYSPNRVVRTQVTRSSDFFTVVKP
jgi:hypothetical protein